MKIFVTLFSLLFSVVALVAIGTAEAQSSDNMCVDPGVIEASTSFLSPEQAPVPVETRCWKCGDKSTGSCSGGDKYCEGERSDCLKKGCKITGSTSQCSGSKTTC